MFAPQIQNWWWTAHPAAPPRALRAGGHPSSRD
ncbi:trp operon leader peptide [Streptomyces venezuelae]|nr:trp operon leader peptide [Streptomyces venezuelae]